MGRTCVGRRSCARATAGLSLGWVAAIVMTRRRVGGESRREPCDTRHLADGSPTRDTLGLVITMSAKAQETGWYGQVRDGTRGTRARRKPALTCTDAHAMGRSVTAEGGVQVPPPTQNDQHKDDERATVWDSDPVTHAR